MEKPWRPSESAAGETFHIWIDPNRGVIQSNCENKNPINDGGFDGDGREAV